VNRTEAMFDSAATDTDRVWPLELMIAALSGLILYLAVTHLTWNDPRWQYNAWTYTIAVPAIGLLLAGVSHLVASRYVQRSVQIGFLFSLWLHLLMLVVAINVIIFHNYFPDAITGIKQERSPIRYTVPEYLFEAPKETATTPDWSRPVDAETASRVVPLEKRRLAPVESTAPELRMPQPQPPEQQSTNHLNRRETPVESVPQLADSPGQRARPPLLDTELAEPSSSMPTAPEVAVDTLAEPLMSDRGETAASRSEDKAFAGASAPKPSVMPADRSDPISASRTSSNAQPELRTTPRHSEPAATSPRRLPAAGAAPAALTIALARQSDSADRVRELLDASVAEKRSTSGADLASGQETGSSNEDLTENLNELAASLRRSDADGEPIPEVTPGPARRPNSKLKSPPDQAELEVSVPEPAGAPSDSVASATGGVAGDVIRDRLSDQSVATQPSNRSTHDRSHDRSSVSLPALGGPALEMLSDQGLTGIADRRDRIAGIVPTDSVPRIAALEISPAARKRRDLGGPVMPFGTEVAAVESFRRRSKRTAGGAAPTPPGAVGPETEEAIERGLEYLASIQNDDGSWSLQGHGSDVILRSDTAATGLALLAFQGAGYTHRQHQYADTVSRGMQFLLPNQKTNGDLDRSENRISNQNVALYSHGIAALAMCEAFGMTQDPELRSPTQAAMDYISDTQHRRRGGWRYTPQVSADTSVTGWMMMALKSGELAGLEVLPRTYRGIERWLGYAQGGEDRADRYRYNPFAPDTAAQRHGRIPTPTMTAVGMLMRMYLGWDREREAMQSAADYLLQYPPQMGTPRSPQRDAYYWYYATMVMFHMGGGHWKQWNAYLKPLLLESQVDEGELAGSWDPVRPLPDRWSPHAGRLYVTTMNLLNLEVYYRHLPIYDETASR